MTLASVFATTVISRELSILGRLLLREDADVFQGK